MESGEDKETCQAHLDPDGSQGSTSCPEGSSQHLALKLLRVQLEDCSHKLGPGGIFVLPDPEFYDGLIFDDSGEEDQDDDDSDGDYIPGSKYGKQGTRRSRGGSGPSRKRARREKGSTSGRYHCSQCRKVYSQLNYLKLHERTHQKKRGPKVPRKSSSKEKSCSLSCDKCSKTFTQLNHLKLHERTHSKPAKIPHQTAPKLEGVTLSCDQCSKTFSQLNHLKLHERTHSKPAKVAHERVPKSEGEAFPCDQCSKTFSQQNYLKLHLRTHQVRQKEGKKTSSQAGSNECDVCGKGFSSLAYLKSHKRTHMEKRCLSCDVCGKTFTLASRFKAHQRSHEKTNSIDNTRQKSRKGRTKKRVGKSADAVDRDSTGAESPKSVEDDEKSDKSVDGAECPQNTNDDDEQADNGGKSL